MQPVAKGVGKTTKITSDPQASVYWRVEKNGKFQAPVTIPGTALLPLHLCCFPPTITITIIKIMLRAVFIGSFVVLGGTTAVALVYQNRLRRNSTVTPDAFHASQQPALADALALPRPSQVTTPDYHLLSDLDRSRSSLFLRNFTFYRYTTCPFCCMLLRNPTPDVLNKHSTQAYTLYVPITSLLTEQHLVDAGDAAVA
jgi:hypothetical protein